MSTQTKYTVTAIDAAGAETEIATKSKKATAVQVARETRVADKVSVKVTTSTGTVVFEAAAPKKIKMSPKYTRVAVLPESVQTMIPEGMRPVFYRKRRHGVILFNTAEQDYTILDTRTGELLEDTFETTRATDEALKELVKL